MFRPNCALLLNYKSVLIAYCLLFFGLMLPYLLLGEVAAPHRQVIEIGAVGTNLNTALIENRKFSDYTNSYIPEIFDHLKGARSGWITLWTNQNELGRSLYQTGGFSPAYLPSWVIAQFTADPWRFITALSLFTCFFAGVFVILFCREIGLHPLAGLIAGVSLAASPLFMYWLTFPMFGATFCWAAGALWGVTRLAKKYDLVGWSVLAFSGYSLLMTAYPQGVVIHAYILGGYGLCLAYRKQQLDALVAGRFLALSMTALIAGAVLALPVYADLAYLRAESVRIAPDPSFFTVYLSKFTSSLDAWKFLVLGTIPELFGNPVETAFPFAYSGLSVTPLVIFFAIICLLVSYKQTWGWWLVIAVFCLLAFVHPLYVLCVKYLGFNLSRGNPLSFLLLPFTIIVAYGADALLKRTAHGELAAVITVATAGVLAVLAIGVGFGLSQAFSIRWWMVLLMLVLTVLLAAQHPQTRPPLLLAALVIVLAAISFPLMLRQDPAQIATTSHLVEKVRANLPTGSRFAVAAPGLSVLPPNLNAALGLASVHSYNSLSSRRYHTLIKELGGEVQTYGRWNGAISPDYNSAMFWMSNISLMLSPMKLTHENLEFLGNESGVYLHKVISRMGDSLQVTSPSQTSMVADGRHIADPRLLPKYIPTKLLGQGDLLEFEVRPGAPSVLILSQKFHRDWQAQAFDQSGWVPAKTTVINGVFQGVLLPQNAQRVRLEFKPYARYAWVAHVFWLILLTLIGFMAWKKKWDWVSKGATTK
ncbi:hypothetical protein HZU77_007800 [Neisseriaceae bacterium TC5R-5]|nr:hypothetical protein [Neisseriaceae bacterium TC5R-5]